MKRAIPIFLLVPAALALVIYYTVARPPSELVLTGIVATDEVIVSPQIQGRIQRLTVNQGDTVTNGELLAEIQPQEQQAEVDFYKSSEQQAAAQLAQAKADLENARLNYERIKNLYATKVEAVQAYDQARTAYEASKAKVASLDSFIGAAKAQEEKAQVELGYTEIHAPVSGVVDTRVALQGEVVNPGQAIVTLINPDNLWVRADVPETFIDRIHPGEKLKVTLPSGAAREGIVFYRGVDAGYATQRDVSRTKRDIKAFEIRLRCDNRDRALAVGMTACVTLPLKNP